jgi:four helix bundle protein
MKDNPNKPKCDLEERTFLFAKNVRMWIKSLPRTISNIEDAKQLTRASGSVGANYIEANESLSKKDFVYRIKICRKEAKESGYWLRLILGTTENLVAQQKGESLLNESLELKKYFHQLKEIRNEVRPSFLFVIWCL